MLINKGFLDISWLSFGMCNVGKLLLLLCLFVVIITINSGLMYQVINPAFQHLTGLMSWYWSVPYIVALVLMRNLPQTAKRSMVLYVGMAMIMGAFVCVTVAILPLLNRQLVKLPKSHACLAVYDNMSADQQTATLNKT